MPAWDTLDLVGGVTVSSSRVSLKNSLSQFGEVSLVWLPPCERRGVDHGYVKFARGEAAQVAFNAISKGQVFVDGNALRVEWRKKIEKARDTRDFDAKGSNLVSARDLYMAGRGQTGPPPSRRRSRSKKRRRGKSKKRRRRSTSSSTSSSTGKKRSKSKKEEPKFLSMQLSHTLVIDDPPPVSRHVPEAPPAVVKPSPVNVAQGDEFSLKSLLTRVGLKPTGKDQTSADKPEVLKPSPTQDPIPAPVEVIEAPIELIKPSINPIEPIETFPVDPSAAAWEMRSPTPAIVAQPTASLTLPPIPATGLLSSLPAFTDVPTPSSGFDAEELKRRVAMVPPGERPQPPPQPPPEPPPEPPEPPLEPPPEPPPENDIAEEEALALLRSLRKNRELRNPPERASDGRKDAKRRKN